MVFITSCAHTQKSKTRICSYSHTLDPHSFSPSLSYHMHKHHNRYNELFIKLLWTNSPWPQHCWDRQTSGEDVQEKPTFGTDIRICKYYWVHSIFKKCEYWHFSRSGPLLDSCQCWLLNKLHTTSCQNHKDKGRQTCKCISHHTREPGSMTPLCD